MEKTPETTIETNDNNDTAAGNQGDAVFSLDTSRGLTQWLAQRNISLAFTTYQVGKLFFIGSNGIAIINLTLPIDSACAC